MVKIPSCQLCKLPNSLQNHKQRSIIKTLFTLKPLRPPYYRLPMEEEISDKFNEINKKRKMLEHLQGFIKQLHTMLEGIEPVQQIIKPSQKPSRNAEQQINQLMAPSSKAQVHSSKSTARTRQRSRGFTEVHSEGSHRMMSIATQREWLASAMRTLFQHTSY